MSLSVDIIKKKIDLNHNIFIYDVIDSTNTEAKRIAEEYDNAVIIADSQTAGRGRLGRSFYSPVGNGLYISFLKECSSFGEDIVLITTAVSEAVCRAIKRVTGKDVMIKWVNALYLDGKKVCGILTEAVRDHISGAAKQIIIGIGINCGNEAFPDEIKEIAGSLGCDDRNSLAAEVINEIDKIGSMIKNKNFMNEYRKKSLVIGKEIKIVNTGEVAEAVDIDDMGGLVVNCGGKIKTLSSGEISIRLYGNNKV